MAHYKKLYEKIRNNPKDVSFQDIDKLLTKIGGFAKRSPKGGSSHYTYSHSDLDEIITIPKDRPIKHFYIKKALSAFETVREEF